MEDCNLTLNICSGISEPRIQPVGKRPVPSDAVVTHPVLPRLSAASDRIEADGGHPRKRRRVPVEKRTGGGKQQQPVSSLFSGNPTAAPLQLPQPQTDGSSVFCEQRFSDLHVHPHLITNVVRELGQSEMTRVQRQAIPAVLDGRDCLIRSPTGSGKTLAYSLPIVHLLQEIQPPVDRKSGLFCLVIVPTHELATQTVSCIQSLTKAFVRLVSGCLMGGENTRAEKRRLRRGLNVLVATPGRLLEHVQKTECLSLARLRWLVLDEADLLMDMGYEKPVRLIIEAIDKQRESDPESRLQTILLSATLDDRVEKLAGLSLSDPARISTDEDSTQMSTPSQLKHLVAIVPAKLRLVALLALILQRCRSRDGKVLVFVNTLHMVEYHAALLQLCLAEYAPAAIKVYKLHGDMSQEERSGMFGDFHRSARGVLICTDVASRGLDVPCIDWIVQYTPPCRAVDYVHRVGRTARAGQAGSALAFLTPAESIYVQTLVEAGVSVSEMSLVSLLGQLQLPTARGPEEAATQLQLFVERAVAEDQQLLQMARKAFTSFVRAYTTYPVEVRTMFSVHALHLGHYAKSLALRETPTHLGRWRSAEPSHRRNTRPGDDRGNRRVRIPQPGDISEFHSGISASVKNKNKKRLLCS